MRLVVISQSDAGGIGVAFQIFCPETEPDPGGSFLRAQAGSSLGGLCSEVEPGCGIQVV